ncbi:MAG TPA: lytic transglycosylase domain-containing protein [Thermosulfurimonas dismutans]|uniref:Lytic transglycosylase domain-containing protein n=1 Tax=Thermosulfurimonas dismutans TaxID=999894 RepID=A0A7C3CW80_9BACT|nr:lytic transglycosylase domain-containing protein [Thermosulfurimonas dismutans]
MMRRAILALFLALLALCGQAGASCPHRYDRHFARYGRLFFPFYPWQWFKAQGCAESGLRPGAVSPVGAVGVMQLMPFTAQEMGCGSLLDPEMNILCGIRYDHWLWRNFWRKRPYPEDLCLTFASYNAGPGRVRRVFSGSCRATLPRLPRETQRYVRRIEAFFVEEMLP